MPRTHITGALLISLALIVGALWTRFSPQNVPEAGLIAIIPEATRQELNADEYFDLLSAQKESQNLAGEPIELMGRQLLSDYLALSSNNQDTPANLDALAAQYANALLLNNSLVPTAKIEQIRVAEDTTENIKAYNQKLTQLRTKYSNLIGPGEKNFADVFDDEFKKIMSALSEHYANAAQELLSFSAPTSLAQNHLRLVNNYLSTSKASLAISHLEESPIGALGGLSALSKNSEEEEALLANIKVLMLSRGLISDI